MRATADADDQGAPPALAPERRLAAIADIFAWGLARALRRMDASAWSPRTATRVCLRDILLDWHHVIRCSVETGVAGKWLPRSRRS